ncbi:MAG: hypothetical protein KDC10_13050 [Calditrichaeota bacterium]|nr:hypothetical protein [Candidatus Cloacimonadota bacterium]MCA9786027.1 hypothetical protein [Candidatus Cloacimonadota bacterium]MCB1048118.1 hypothetical protein [Calditrichota bacterium]MCB9474896.1 hypothetical protein [Candidatus Delongbacteria bacterium]
MNRLPANLVRILVLLLLALRPALAEMCESTGEYEYTHGDNESIIQAKQFCEQMALRAAIEQCALFVSSISTAQNYQMKDDLVKTIAAAVVKQKKVLEQRVDGRTVYYKVSVKLDDEQMSQAIEAERLRLQGAGAAGGGPVFPRVPAPDLEGETSGSPEAGVPLDRSPVMEPVSHEMPTSGSGSAARRHLSVRLGQKSLSKDDWEPLESQVLLGMDFNWGLSGLPVSLDIGYLRSSKSGDVEDEYGDVWDGYAETSELTVGARWWFGQSDARLVPYLGAGLCLVKGYWEVDMGADGTYSIEGSTMGFALNGGMLASLSRSLYTGVDLRVSGGNVTLEGDDVWGDPVSMDAKAGGLSISLLLGYRW